MRREVIAAFRQLHRTRKNVFRNDTQALEAGREKINEEFKQNINEANPDKIAELVKIAVDAEMLLRQTVVQAQLNQEGRYVVKFSKDTKMLDNVPYNEDVVISSENKQSERKLPDD